MNVRVPCLLEKLSQPGKYRLKFRTRLSLVDQIQPFEQRQRNDHARFPPVPEPIVRQHIGRWGMTINFFAIADERQRDDEQIGLRTLRAACAKELVHIFCLAVEESACRVEISRAGIDDSD